MKRALAKLLAKWDINLARISSSMLSNSPAVAQRIGTAGAAEALAYYIKNYDQLSTDCELRDFMEFYAENYRLSTSQWSQDAFVMFASTLKREGRFLEIGGADGYSHSNTYALEKQLGWRGTLVEPDPSQFKSLQATRPNNTLLNAAISPRDREEVLTLRLVGQYSALQGHEGEDAHIQTRLQSHEFVTVKGISLSRILAAETFDYFSLDIEGAELDILRSIQWPEVNKPAILTVEHNSRDNDKREMLTLLRAQGYRERFASHHWLRRGDLWMTLDA